jgi:hypothetical protein
MLPEFPLDMVPRLITGTPLLTSLLATCAPLLTSLLATRAPRRTPLHASRLGLSI